MPQCLQFIRVLDSRSALDSAVEVSALQEDSRAAKALGQTLCERDRRLAPHVFAQQRFKLALKRFIGARFSVCGLQLFERMDQRLRHETAAVLTEMPVHVRKNREHT